MTTIQEFITTHGIVATATQIDSNPNMTDMPEGSKHWSVMLLRVNGDDKMTVEFSQGPAHTQPPTAEDVLDCLASDAVGWNNAEGFEDWCGEYGYDTDSRRAERTYNAIRKQSMDLVTFLSMRQYDNLLWNTERL
jgi:hypothetical protein